jgi:hypothetical protein
MSSDADVCIRGYDDLMRTTLNLPDALVERAKRRAAEEGTTLTGLIEAGLQYVLELPRPERTVTLPTHGAASDRPRVDILDKDALWEALDADDPA